MTGGDPPGTPFSRADRVTDPVLASAAPRLHRYTPTQEGLKPSVGDPDDFLDRLGLLEHAKHEMGDIGA
jgi:hypothetical protein